MLRLLSYLISNFGLRAPKEYLSVEKQNFKNVTFTESVSEAVKDSDLISTDVWISMGDETESEERIKAV